MGNSIQISGTVSDIIFANDENGYTVCGIESVEEGDFVATGYMPYINEGDSLLLTGEWVTHPDYGEQFKVSGYESILPKDKNAIYKYLATGIVKGVREATAKKLIEKFGNDTLNVMLNEPMRMAEVSGISKKKAEEIGEAFFKLQAVQGIVMFLQQYGVSANMALKIYKVFGNDAIEIIKKNPYLLADRVDGISFKTADNIAFVMGISKNSMDRLTAGVKFILSSAGYISGHTYLPKALLVEDAAYNLNVTEIEVENAISTLMLRHELYIEDVDGTDACYLTYFMSAEEYIARRLASMSLTEQKFNMTREDAKKTIDEIEKEENITLAYEQRRAVITALDSSCTVITGGPGTGKTTTINAIIKIMERLNLSIALAAPTGRAAKRMSELTGYDAKTIHRLLGVVPDSENRFTHDERNPLTADVVIVDEVSMVDVQLMYAFLRAIKGGARIILCGDADQLPSVGAGNVLKDIIDSDIIPVIRLEQIFRQAEESLIVVNAHKINHGEMPELDAKNKDFFFLKRKNIEEVRTTIADLFVNRLPKSYGIDPVSSIQILSPSKRGEVGTVKLNQMLQDAINPHSDLKMEYSYGTNVFRVGDKVMQTKNNYDIPWLRKNGEHGMGIFNGDMGIIAEISTKNKMMVIIFDEDKEVEYQFAYLDELDLAYAVTVHKSQGSEFPVVIIPACNFPPALMCKNLLYTAVTRAKAMVVLVGSEASIMRMVSGADMKKRYTGLSDRLKTMVKITKTSFDV